MADYDVIQQDLAEAQNKLRQLAETLRNLDAQRAQIIPEINGQQGIIRFLVDKIPGEDRESVITALQIEESADSNS